MGAAHFMKRNLSASERSRSSRMTTSSGGLASGANVIRRLGTTSNAVKEPSWFRNTTLAHSIVIIGMSVLVPASLRGIFHQGQRIQTTTKRLIQRDDPSMPQSTLALV